jgi:hypothetical protein
MKLILFFTAVILSMGTTCKKEKMLPTCIQQKIDAIKAEPKWNPPAEVTEYVYNGKTVYGFSANCCDQFYEVYDAECNWICAPSGGIGGNGDHKCTDFQQNAKVVRVVYKDTR